MKKLNKQTPIIIILLLSGFLGFAFYWYQHRNTVIDVPVTDIPITQTFHSPVTFVSQLTGDPDAGRKIFNEYCTSCHGKQPIIDIPAPRIGDRKTWKIRQQIGMPALLKITTMGVGAMPARGGCFECSDQQLQETIQYMLDQSR